MKPTALLFLGWGLGATLAAACAVDVDHGATAYSCVEEPVCPSGFDCVEGRCVAAGASAIDSGPIGFDASLLDAAGEGADADVGDPDAGGTTITAQVIAGSDDAEELVADGTVVLGSSDLELVVASTGQQFVGIRFAAVDLPQGAQVSSATIQFTVDEVSLGDATVTIGAEDNVTPATFTTALNDISGRAPLATLVPWTIDEWPTVGEAGPAQRTPDLSVLVQALVDKAEWQAGNAMVFGIQGMGTRTAESFNGVPAAAPVLQVVFQ